jgi:ABC-2 type transport system ATP-binding protein
LTGAVAVGEQQPIIVASEVTKRFGRVVALERFSLEVRRGEVFCLLGPNGSGKTTFLRTLTGFLLPSAGSLRVAGYDVVQEPNAVKRRIGYVPEAVPMYRHMRVGEFIAFMARLRGMPSRTVAGAVRRAAQKLGLEERLNAPIPTLSRGYRQRVAIAQALVHDPELLVLDEPTNGLDPRQIIETRNLIRSLAGATTVLMSSHILSEVQKTADRVAVLLGGRLMGVQSITAANDLETWFLSLA